MKEYSIPHDIERIRSIISDLETELNDLNAKVKRAKIYPQLLNDTVWVEI